MNKNNKTKDKNNSKSSSHSKSKSRNMTTSEDGSTSSEEEVSSSIIKSSGDPTSEQSQPIVDDKRDDLILDLRSQVESLQKQKRQEREG